MNTVIFAGPSISHGELRQVTSAKLAPPAKRGDLHLYSEFDTFVIIDGEFGQNLSVSPKEILSLLDKGKTIVGASSMGALRASELDSCGMIGVGWVYERFARSAVRRDDDVALAYSPLDFTPVSIPMVDVEYWVMILREQNLISASERTTILKAARKIFFAERTRSKLWRALSNTIGLIRLGDLLEYTSGELPNIKYEDARRAVSFADLSVENVLTKY
jgi:hypothetical protein